MITGDKALENAIQAEKNGYKEFEAKYRDTLWTISDMIEGLSLCGGRELFIPNELRQEEAEIFIRYMAHHGFSVTASFSKFHIKWN